MSKLTPAEAHELYLDLADIRAQLENSGEDTASLEKQESINREILSKNGYDPDLEPEECYPENRTAIGNNATIQWVEMPSECGPYGVFDKLPLQGKIDISISYPSACNPHLAVMRVRWNGITKHKKDMQVENREDAKRKGLQLAMNVLAEVRRDAQREEDIVRNAFLALYPEN